MTRSKYGNKKTVIRGEKFDSQTEGLHWLALQSDARIGKIAYLRRQVRFPLIVCDKLICTYVADFYFLQKDGRPVIHEVKGMRTRDYIIKAKLFKVLYPDIIFREIPAKDSWRLRKAKLPVKHLMPAGTSG